MPITETSPPIETIFSLLKSYELSFPKEKTVLDEFRKFLKRAENPLRRECLEGHITSSAWIVNSSGEKMLLMHHRKLDKWIQLGGHADGDSHLIRVIRKEVQEEAGLTELTFLHPLTGSPISDENMPIPFDLDIHDIPAYKSVPPHKHYDVRFLMQASGKEIPAKNDESFNLGWLTEPEILEQTQDLSVTRMVHKWNEVFHKLKQVDVFSPPADVA